MSEPQPQPGDTLVAAGLKVLLEPDPLRKAAFCQTAAALWRSGAISRVCDAPLLPSQIPDCPSRRSGQVQLVAPTAMPRLRKGGTLASRQAIIHSLVHIELAAVDLSWDIIVRFGTSPSYQLPTAFFDDFVQVAADEASHFSLLNSRLEALGSHYGAFPAHDGLWESAAATAHSLPARLAVEHCVHEARGLDVLPSTVQKFRVNGDAETAALLEDVIYEEEISHCAAGVRWLVYLHQLAKEQQQQQQQQQPPKPREQPLQEQQHQQRCAHDQQAAPLPAAGLGQQPPGADPAAAAAGGGAGAGADADAADRPGGHAGAAACCSCGVRDWAADARQHDTVEAWFHALIRRHFKGNLKPPFNEAARAKAGFGPEWYLPLTAAAAADKAATGEAGGEGALAATTQAGAGEEAGCCSGSAAHHAGAAAAPARQRP